MSTKSTTAASKLPDISKLSESELDALMATARAAKTDRARQEQAKEESRKNALTATFESLPKSMGNILGKPVSLLECAKMLLAFARTGGKSKVSASKASSKARTSTSDGNKAKRLNDGQKAAIRADMLQHSIRQRLNTKGGDTIEVIARRHGVSPQTIDKYRPTKEDVQAAVASLVPPSVIVPPVAAAAETPVQSTEAVAATA